MHCSAIWFKLTAFASQYFAVASWTAPVLWRFRLARLHCQSARRLADPKPCGACNGSWKTSTTLIPCIGTMNPSGSSDRFGVPPSGGPDRLKPGLQTFGPWRESMHHGWQTRQSPAPHFCFGSLARSHQFVRPSFHGSCRLNPTEIFRPFTSTLNFFVVQPDAGRA